MDDTVSESVFVEVRKVDAPVGRQRRVAPAADDGPHDQMALIDQSGFECLCREGRPSDEHITAAADRRGRPCAAPATSTPGATRTSTYADFIDDFHRLPAGYRAHLQSTIIESRQSFPNIT